MGNYTPESIERVASDLEDLVGVTRAATAVEILRDYATLRQQAGRVDEWMARLPTDATLDSLATVDAARAVARVLRDELRAALAQNTQGDGEAVAFDVELEREINHLRGFFADPCPAWVNRHIEWIRANVRHAERARVPDGWVPRAVAEVAQGDLHMLKKAIEARDPWPELLVRVNDTERDLRTALAAAPSQRAEVK